MVINAPCDYKGNKFIDTKKVHLPHHYTQAGQNYNKNIEYSKEMIESMGAL